MHEDHGNQEGHECHGHDRAKAQQLSSDADRGHAEDGRGHNEKAAYENRHQCAGPCHGNTLALYCRQNDYKDSYHAADKPARNGGLLNFPIRSATQYGGRVGDEPSHRDHARDNTESGGEIAGYRANRQHLPILGIRNAQVTR
jgi:hypothetical protein